MNIQIINMTLFNFKGVRNVSIDFGQITNISGENGTGKTSIFDAFTWLLFGKNSKDEKDFNIKTLDENNQPIHNLSHEVTATLSVDGRVMKFKRGYREKWVKKRGESEAEFTGHETEYFIDDVPLNQKEFQARVDIIMNENIAKMITSPTYFNSIKWQDRRSILEAIAGTINNEDIAATNVAFRELLSKIGNEKIADFKKRIAAQKLNLKKNLETLPTRIDEAERSKPEAADYASLEKQAAAIKAKIADIDAAIEDKVKFYDLEYRKIQELQKQKFELENKLAAAKQNQGASKRKKIAELQSEISLTELKLKTSQSWITSNSAKVANNNARIENLSKGNDALRNSWNAENSKTLVIDEHALTCPACKQNLPEAEQESIRANLASNFNNAKKSALEKIELEGKNNASEIEKLKKEIEEFAENTEAIAVEIETYNDRIEWLKKDIEEVKNWEEGKSPETQELEKQIAEFIIPESPRIDTSELKVNKQTLTEILNGISEKLSSKSQIEKLNARIEELKLEESKQAQELANLERLEFTMAEFSKAKIEIIENRINGKFKMVKFKMFEQQINGGESECCECMVNGVPYSDVNTAGKINAGIDIINALSEHYNINAPVFVDNRESIINMLPCKSQIINLRAVKGQPLMVVTEEDVLESVN